MGRKPMAATRRDESKVEVQAILNQLAGQVRAMLALKDQELALDHANDLKAQDVLQLIRQIKRESTEERISAYAHIAETYLMRQIDEDQQDDVPWQKERDLLVDLSNRIEKALQEARTL